MLNELLTITIPVLVIITLFLVWVTTRFYFLTKTLRQENWQLRNSVHRLKKDRLTGVLKRDAWEEELEERLKVTGQVICMIDLDNLKKINDTYGHVYGDKAITLLAATLGYNLKETDLIGRYGGDEFVVALELENEERVLLILERIRKQFIKDMQNYFTNQFGETQIDIGFSYGCTLVSSNMHNIEIIYQRADDELYKQKKLRLGKDY